jgi:hypothetical protein
MMRDAGNNDSGKACHGIALGEFGGYCKCHRNPNYADEGGFAPWQGANTLNAKGFGTITDLAIAANDNNPWPERPFRFAVVQSTVDDKERYTLNKMEQVG